MPFIRGTDVKANVFLFAQTAIPHHVIRRTDFADSTLPHIAAHPTYVEQLVEQTHTHGGSTDTRCARFGGFFICYEGFAFQCVLRG